jgi:hypothetical protein
LLLGHYRILMSDAPKQHLQPYIFRVSG